VHDKNVRGKEDKMQTAKTEYLTELKLTLDNYTEQLANIKQHFQNSTENDVDALTKALKSILGKAQDSYKKLAAASEEDWDEAQKITAKIFEELQKEFIKVLGSSSAKLKQVAKEATQDMEKQLQNIEIYVKENPFKSILLSLGLGLFIGKLLK
jgi:ElaB/YqjD/DUF883 family membrane-anchored ribosome-binding protein